MKKFLQNKVAESRMALPACAVLATLVWLLCGLASQHWWIQFLCFGVTAYLMVLLNNMHVLIRIYSRMVSCVFLLLACSACFLFPSIRGGIMQVSVVAFYLILFHTYQDRQAAGLTFYAFACLGVGTMVYVQLLYFVPFFWLLMATNLLSLSWRTWGASLVGLLLPYWFGCTWLVWQNDFTMLTDHFSHLDDFQFPVNYARLGIRFMSVIGLLIVCTITGIVHYLNKSYNDKIRLRMLYGIFVWIDLLALAAVCVQPQHQDMLLRLAIVNTAPLLAHFLALTSTKITDAAFRLFVAATLLIIAYNVWTSSYLF